MTGSQCHTKSTRPDWIRKTLAQSASARMPKANKLETARQSFSHQCRYRQDHPLMREAQMAKLHARVSNAIRVVYLLKKALFGAVKGQEQDSPRDVGLDEGAIRHPRPKKFPGARKAEESLKSAVANERTADGGGQEADPRGCWRRRAGISQEARPLEAWRRESFVSFSGSPYWVGVNDLNGP
ncbi:hypothetical protein DL766_008788 [Monosporascus sp. MC13-8B]|uniref:Uncharacterized protein n=1 Tax=Monosporascus cannonballus TaxID=155416 RepID=A0ABY0GZ64_9PEZI|nr:hypothetical protein DL762_007430 [Monosporascus cannonballus]RYO83456.1 hypothetical protein DL763_007865 [Monosporascus cannonballus]RYP17938.1 hypothetical protein DL766_008788 [Monosporascus sp. MC13-8B]